MAFGRSGGVVIGCYYGVPGSGRPLLKVQRSNGQWGAVCVSQPRELLAGVFKVELTPRPTSSVAGLTEGGLVEWVRESDARVTVLDATFVSHDIWM